MRPNTSQWRDNDAYTYMNDLPVEDLAWECLRRNRHYQKDFARHVRRKGGAPDGEVAVAHRWGLRFRRASEPFGPGSAGLLDT